MRPDELRFIPNVNTQVRYIPYVSFIVKVLGNSFLPLNILKDLSLKWSKNLEDESSYNNQHGKITKMGEATSAFGYYISFVESVGLIARINEFTRCTKYGVLYNAISRLDPIGKETEISVAEKYFFIFLLFEKDADVLLLVMDILYLEGGFPVRQMDVAKKFELYFKARLKEKQNSVALNSNIDLFDKLLKVNFKWEEISSYAKHIISTRLEWLIFFGFLTRGNDKKYSFTDKGACFYMGLPKIVGCSFRDINKEWLTNNAFTDICKVLNDKVQNLQSLELDIQKKMISEALQCYFDEFGTDSSSRISTYPAFIFSSIYLLVRHSIVSNFIEFSNSLTERLEIGNKLFVLRPAVRVNESYISILYK